MPAQGETASHDPPRRSAAGPRRAAPAARAIVAALVVPILAGCAPDRGDPAHAAAPVAPTAAISEGCSGDFNGGPGPVVAFDLGAFALAGPADCACAPGAITAPDDTVCAFSTVTFAWTAVDAAVDVACWKSTLDGGPWISHARDDTTRTAHAMAPGRHVLTVLGVDVHGNLSRVAARFGIQVGFDPATEVDVEKLFVHGPPGGGAGAPLTPHGVGAPDTIPYGSRLGFRWSSRGCGGRVVSYDWSFALQSGQTSGRSATTAPLLTGTRDGTRGFPLTVQGVNEHGARENRPDTLWMHVNLRPWARWLDAQPLQIPVGTPHDFAFEGDDRDGDPALLTYSWFLDAEIPGPPVGVPPDSMFVRRAFSPADVGPHRLVLLAYDQSGPARPAEPDTLWFDVVP